MVWHCQREHKVATIELLHWSMFEFLQVEIQKRDYSFRFWQSSAAQGGQLSSLNQSPCQGILVLAKFLSFFPLGFSDYLSNWSVFFNVSLDNRKSDKRLQG
jgi:hypothetical protein